MNKDELIKLKERLIIQTKTKKYGYFDPTSAYVDPEDVKTVEEITSEIDTQKAIETFELLMENFVRYLVDRGTDFQKIIFSIPIDLFASEHFLNKCANDEKCGYERSDITKEDILYDVIPLSIMFQAFETDEKNSWIDLDDSEYAEIRPIGTVKYSEFVKGLELLGYDVSLKTFDEFFTEACGLCHGSKIVIDFAKEKKHTL